MAFNPDLVTTLNSVIDSSPDLMKRYVQKDPAVLPKLVARALVELREDGRPFTPPKDVADTIIQLLTPG